MNEVEIERAFYLFGTIQGLLQGYAMQHDLKHSQETLDRLQNSFIPLLDFMKEGAKAIREIEKLKNQAHFTAKQDDMGFLQKVAKREDV